MEYAQAQEDSKSIRTPSTASSQQSGHLDQTRTAKQVYAYMSTQVESTQLLSLEVQEKYGQS